MMIEATVCPELADKVRRLTQEAAAHYEIPAEQVNLLLLFHWLSRRQDPRPDVVLQ